MFIGKGNTTFFWKNISTGHGTAQPTDSALESSYISMQGKWSWIRGVCVCIASFSKLCLQCNF